jgi:hypothetical protein
LSWFGESGSSPVNEDEISSTIDSAFAAVETKGNPSISGGKSPAAKRFDMQGSAVLKEFKLTRVSLETSLTRLLVVIQSCLAKEEWSDLLPQLWSNLGENNKAVASVSRVRVGHYLAHESLRSFS